MIYQLLLKVLFTIFGIEAASGLYYSDKNLYIVGDKSPYLYSYNLKNKELNKTNLKTDLLEKDIDKKNKPDFESITFYQDNLYILGSGSGLNRNDLFIVNQKTNEIKNYDLKDLYKTLQEICNVPENEFNIEGIAIHEDLVYLFQRGNGEQNINGIFTFPLDFLTLRHLAQNVYKFTRVDLPKIKDYPSGFSDAVIYEGKIYFTATAEGNFSTYHDGEVLGSILGEINLKDLAINRTEYLSDSHKVEGLTIRKSNRKKIEFWLCVDNDNEEQKSEILQYIWKK